MYERFTDRARKVMQLTNQEAKRFRHEYIGTEHILLGLAKEGNGVAANVLKKLDVDLHTIRLEAEKLVQSEPEMVTMGRLPQTPRAKKVIEYAMDEARSLNHHYVGTEHILLGLLREQEGVAAQVLMNLGLKLDEVREEVLSLLGYNIKGAQAMAEVAAPQDAGTSPSVSTSSKYERFTDRARKVFQLANQEANRFNHDYLGTEHILLGLLREDGVAAGVLENLNVDPRRIRKEIEKLLQSEPELVTVGRLPHTPHTRKVVEYAQEEALRLKHDHVGTAHLLLGLLREQEGVAAQVLMNFGLKLEEVRKEVLRAMEHGLEARPVSSEEADDQIPQRLAPSLWQRIVRRIKQLFRR